MEGQNEAYQYASHDYNTDISSLWTGKQRSVGGVRAPLQSVGQQSYHQYGPLVVN
jgi:hypothetical protein